MAADSPDIYLQDPDPLSVLLDRLDLGADVYVNGDFCGTWAVDTSGSKRIPFHIIGSGHAWLHFEGDNPRHLQSGDLVVFPRDAHHVIADSQAVPLPQQINAPVGSQGAKTSMICGFFEFRNPALFPFLETLPQLVLLASGGPDARRTDQLIELMGTELSEASAGHYAVVDQIAFLIFVEVIRRLLATGTVEGGLLQALFDEKLGRALNAIHRHPERPWTLSDLAQEAAMSRAAFADRFADLVGLAPMKYVTRWRMTMARRLLQTTGFSIAQIAPKCGYESEAAFRKAFRKTLGQTPGEVRRAPYGACE